MGALENLFPLLQVDELLGENVHVAAEADAFLHRGDGGAVAPLADELIPFQERRRYSLAQFFPLLLQAREALLQALHRGGHLRRPPRQDGLALLDQGFRLLKEPFPLLQMLHEFQHAGFALVPLILLEGDFLEHRLVFDVALDLHQAAAALFDAVFHCRDLRLRVTPLLLQVPQFLKAGGLLGPQVFQGRFLGFEFARELLQLAGDLLNHLIQLLDFDEPA